MQSFHTSSRPPPASSSPSQRVQAQLYGGAFIGESTLESWAQAGLVRRCGCVLSSVAGPEYLLIEACRVLGPKRGEVDPLGMSGKVESVRELIRQGAALSSGALRVGQLGYDVEFGYMLTPLGERARP